MFHSVAAPDRRAGAVRFDIQFLRGVAVLLVVLFHGIGNVFPRGFLGVDVFFVLSGYLITGLVLRDLEAGSFSFGSFYLRRAKRLLPAAYSTFLGTTLLGYVLLTSEQWHMYLRQLAGAVTFTANIVLWLQTDYFAPAAETKPLLHIWSLSLEEQFYFLMPALLWAVAGRWRPALIFGGLLLSLALCIAAAGRPVAFFVLPTRAWELFAGSVCAWLVLHRNVHVPRPLQWLSLGVILLVCLVGFDPVHPRGDAVLVVLATVMLILGGDGWLPENMLNRAIATVGDWSYSLYLIHWPLFSFAFLAYMGEPPMAVVLALALLSCLLAWLQFRFVETPFRRAWPTAPRRAWVAFAAMTIGLVASATPAAVANAPETADRSDSAMMGLARECRQDGPNWRDIPACRTSATPSIAVWGDSNAMQLVPALSHLPMIQITKVGCAPILGAAQITDSYTPDWAQSCISFNQGAFRHIAADPNLRTVIVASAFYQLLTDTDQRLLDREGVGRWRAIGHPLLVETLRRLRGAGKTVILVAPIPRVSFDPALCHARAREGVFTAGRSGCDFDESEFLAFYVNARDELASVAREAGVSFYAPEAAICPRGRCRTSVGSEPIYRNDGHLTSSGARFVVRQLGLGERLAAR